MNIVQYYVEHVFPSGFGSIRRAFRTWKDLMSGNWADYAVRQEDDPFIECRDWFWVLLGEDDVLPKFFLEDLQALMDRIDRGEEPLIPINFEELDRLDQLLEDMASQED
jgi:hypothetical protein